MHDRDVSPAPDDGLAPVRPTAPAAPASSPFDPARLIEFVDDAVIALDPGFRITSWNRAAEALYGWSAGEAIGQNISAVVATTYPSGDRATVLGAISSTGRWQGDVIQRDRQGRALAIDASVTSVRDADGQVVGFVTVNRDSSARKAAEAQLRALAQRLEVLAAAARAFAEPAASYAALLDRIAQSMVAALGDFCLVRLLSADAQQLELVASAHAATADDSDRTKFDAITAGVPLSVDAPDAPVQVFRTGTPLLLARIERAALKSVVAPAFQAIVDRVPPHSMLSVALQLQGRSIGLLTLGRYRPTQPPFDAADVTLAQDLADRAALAIDHARLVEQLQHELAERQQAAQALRAQTTRLEVLVEASRAFAAAGLDPQSVLDQVVRQTAAQMDAGCILRVRSDDGQMLQTAAIFDQDAALQADLETLYATTPIPITAPHPAVLVMQSGEPLFAPVVNADALRATMAPELRPAFDRARPSSAIITALRVQGDSLGSLVLSRHRPGAAAFTEDDLAVAQDLADRAALALTNARLFQQVQAALATRDVFLSIAAHELRTPLTSLAGHATRLARRPVAAGPLGERERVSLTRILEHTERLNRLIEDLLDVTRIQEGRLSLAPELLDLGALVAQVAAEIGPSLDVHHFDLAVPAAPVWVRGDPHRLAQVVANLIQNAVKYSPAGGVIGVQLVQQDATAELHVTDQGMGIPARDVPYLFERFYRASNIDAQQIRGFGIGLALVSAVVAEHGGHIDVASSEGVGSTFTVRLPTAAPPDA